MRYQLPQISSCGVRGRDRGLAAVVLKGDSGRRYLVLGHDWTASGDHLEEIGCEVAAALFGEHIDGTPEFRWHLYADADHPIVPMLLRLGGSAGRFTLCFHS
jgi:hypothetical protein